MSKFAEILSKISKILRVFYQSPYGCFFYKILFTIKMLRVMVTVLTLFTIASSEISRNEDLLEEYMMYKKFLDKLTPRVSKFHLILKEI